MQTQDQAVSEQYLQVEQPSALSLVMAKLPSITVQDAEARPPDWYIDCLLEAVDPQNSHPGDWRACVLAMMVFEGWNHDDPFDGPDDDW